MPDCPGTGTDLICMPAAYLDMQPIVIRSCKWRDNGAGMKVGRGGYTENQINKRMIVSPLLETESAGLTVAIFSTAAKKCSN